MRNEPVSLAHHWMVTYRGGEKVLSDFRRLFPSAGLSTLVSGGNEIPEWIRANTISSPLAWIPFSARFYKLLLPLHPWAIKRLSHPAGVKLVLSSDASMIKGLKLRAGVKQVCYCHSPPRYLWGMEAEYLGRGWRAGLFRRVAGYLRNFDATSAKNVDSFIANSRFVAERIRKYYGKDSVVIYPPVAVEDFCPRATIGEHFLLVSQLVPYKRVDIAVDAFTKIGRPLIVIGQGSELAPLRRRAGPNVKFLGRQPFSVIKQHYETCRAFINPQIEDFGITAVEAHASGRPVIAFHGGGALETVTEGETGIFFDTQSPESLIDAIFRFERFSPEAFPKCRKSAERFSGQRFRREIKDYLVSRYPEVFDGYVWPDIS